MRTVGWDEAGVPPSLHRVGQVKLELVVCVGGTGQALARGGLEGKKEKKKRKENILTAIILS